MSDQPTAAEFEQLANNLAAGWGENPQHTPGSIITAMKYLRSAAELAEELEGTKADIDTLHKVIVDLTDENSRLVAARAQLREQAGRVSVPTTQEISDTLQLFRAELHKRMDLNHHSASPGHEAMTIALHKLFKDRSASPPTAPESAREGVSPWCGCGNARYCYGGGCSRCWKAFGHPFHKPPQPYWMIERGSPCEWWVGNLRIPNEDGGEWTTDSSKAQHFPDDWRAKLHAKELESWGIPGPLRATEHIDMPTPAPEPERPAEGLCGCRERERMLCSASNPKNVVGAVCEEYRRIAAGKEFAPSLGGQSNTTTPSQEGPAGEQATGADMDAEIGPTVMHLDTLQLYVANSAPRGGGMDLAQFRNALREWLAKHGTFDEGRRAAAAVCREHQITFSARYNEACRDCAQAIEKMERG